MCGLKLRRFVAICVLALAPSVSADIIVDYTIDAGGSNTNGIDGLAARSTWSIVGDQLTILLENVSTGVPDGFGISDSLLVSLAFDLPGADIIFGNSAVIATDSFGLGSWSSFTAGDSVADQWLWTNGYGGDLLGDYRQIITTSMGVRGSGHLDFNGNTAKVKGPFGGITADANLLASSRNQNAVTNGILFTVTLDNPLTEADLLRTARNSVVEFGSDFQYLAVPGPGPLGLLVLAGMTGIRRRRRRTG